MKNKRKKNKFFLCFSVNKKKGVMKNFMKILLWIVLAIILGAAVYKRFIA